LLEVGEHPEYLYHSLQIRDYRPDWDLEVKEPVAGNYYPVISQPSVMIHAFVHSVELDGIRTQIY